MKRPESRMYRTRESGIKTDFSGVFTGECGGAVGAWSLLPHHQRPRGDRGRQRQPAHLPAGRLHGVHPRERGAGGHLPLAHCLRQRHRHQQHGGRLWFGWSSRKFSVRFCIFSCSFSLHCSFSKEGVRGKGK